MHSNTTNEIAVGATGIMLGMIALDDPTLAWLNANLITLVVVTTMTMAVTGVMCLLSPAPTSRITLGRILASGIFAAGATVIAGAMSVNGNGPAAIAAIILVSGIAGWMVLMGILEYATSMRESPEFKKNVGTMLWNVVLRIFNIPRQTTAPTVEMDLTKLADAGGRTKSDSEKFAERVQKVMDRRKDVADAARERVERNAPAPDPEILPGEKGGPNDGPAEPAR